MNKKIELWYGGKVNCELIKDDDSGATIRMSEVVNQGSVVYNWEGRAADKYRKDGKVTKEGFSTMCIQIQELVKIEM